MGYTTSQFFIVHGWDTASIREARKIAISLFGSLVSPVMTGVINDVDGFMVWTSGSKDGWSESDTHIANIGRLIDGMAQMERPPRWTWASSGEEVGDLRIEHGYDGDYTHTYKRANVSRLADGRTESVESTPSRDARPSLLRFLWRSVADGNACSCYKDDPCPECAACEALGWGKYQGPAWLESKLMEVTRG